MTERYFVEWPLMPGSARLAGPEGHHLIHVMRAVPGTRVVLFDGVGGEAAAVVQRVGRTEVELEVLACGPIDRELPWELTLGVALPKGQRQKWLVEKAVELGVTRLVPLASERAVAQPGEQALGRLRRTVIEASKQCGRNRLMEVAQPTELADYLAREGHALRLLAHPAGAAGRGISPRLSTGPALLAVGPEGGFAEQELARAIAAGWQVIGLGPRILRVETAALALVAALTLVAPAE